MFYVANNAIECSKENEHTEHNSAWDYSPIYWSHIYALCAVRLEVVSSYEATCYVTDPTNQALWRYNVLQ